jgi:hypothetical protein
VPEKARKITEQGRRLSYRKKFFVPPRPRRKRHPRRIAVFWLPEFVPFTQKLVGQAAISKKVFILLQKNSIITP